MPSGQPDHSPNLHRSPPLAPAQRGQHNLRIRSLIPMEAPTSSTGSDDARVDHAMELSQWIRSKERCYAAARAILHHKSIWPDEVAEEVIDSVHAEYREHIEAAHAWLRATMSLLEQADIDGEGGHLPCEVNPTADTIAFMCFTLDKNESYFHTIQRALEVIFGYIEHERQLLREWVAEQAQSRRWADSEEDPNAGVGA
ncbi:hypothetical protein OH77DRAFT_1431804 [Trametes cingulata]|nr:hypothetical protein OH77DRAFT_1431804 [Trametes cingulata]